MFCSLVEPVWLGSAELSYYIYNPRDFKYWVWHPLVVSSKPPICWINPYKWHLGRKRGVHLLQRNGVVLWSHASRLVVLKGNKKGFLQQSNKNTAVQYAISHKMMGSRNKILSGKAMLSVASCKIYFVTSWRSGLPRTIVHPRKGLTVNRGRVVVRASTDESKVWSLTPFLFAHFSQSRICVKKCSVTFTCSTVHLTVSLFL